MNIERALAVEGWLTEAEAAYLASVASRSVVAIEVGSWMGRSTCAIAANIQGYAWAVDTWRGSAEHVSMLAGKPSGWLYERFLANTKGLPAIPLMLPSLEAAVLLQRCGQRADMIFIDANHAYEGAYVDNVNLSATVSLPGPTIIGFAPASGSVGSSVTLTGSGLSGASAVRFNGVAASFTPFSDTQLNCTVPPGASSGPISVTTSAGTARSAASFIVMQAGPHISTLSPGSGKRGATVTITGSGFGAVLGSGSVRFGARSCSLYLSWSNTRITCKVPAKAAFGRLSVAVRSSSGVSNAVGFTVKR